MTFKHLDDATLQGVVKAMIDLGWTSDADFDALTAGMSPAFVGSVRGSGGGNARLVVFAGRVNATRVLVNGEVPLNQLLANAVLLAAGRPEEVIFRTALERMSMDGRRPVDTTPAAASPGPDVVAAPADHGQLEIALGEDDTLEVDFLSRGVEASRSVAKLLVHRHFGGVPSMLGGNVPDLGLGTGWLLAPRLLITNHHVVNARLPGEPTASDSDFALQGRSITVRFDYLSAASPEVTTRSVECLAADAVLDFALLRLPHDAPDRPPLRLRGQPIVKEAAATLRQRVNVLQHPNGLPMRLGFRNNFVVAGTAERLSYLTDTAGGSSGSPISDDKWYVAGLHRGFTTITGDPVLVWGMEIRQENYGTPVGAILAFLQSHHPALHAEIGAGQAALPPDPP